LSDISGIWFRRIVEDSMEATMPWTDITRVEHRRNLERYSGDLSDQEWTVLSRFVPAARPGGTRRTTDMRNVLSAILYIAEGGSPGGCCRKIFRQYRPFGAIFTSGAMTGCDRDPPFPSFPAPRFRRWWLCRKQIDAGAARHWEMAASRFWF
jgi:transposase